MQNMTSHSVICFFFFVSFSLPTLSFFTSICFTPAVNTNYFTIVYILVPPLVLSLLSLSYFMLLLLVLFSHYGLPLFKTEYNRFCLYVNFRCTV